MGWAGEKDADNVSNGDSQTASNKAVTPRETQKHLALTGRIVAVTPRSRAKKSPPLYITKVFITVSTTARNLSLTTAI